MLTSFDPDKGPLFKGEFTYVGCHDPADPGHVPNLVIDPDKPFEIEVRWELKGYDVPLYLAALDANWTVEAFAESLGPGPEKRIAQASVGKGPPRTPASYTVKMTVPARTLEEGNPGGGPSGVYKLVCTCFLNSALGAPGFDIAGFAEGPVIRVECPE